MANATKHDDYSPSDEFKAKLDRIDRPDKFADFFCEAAKSQVAIKSSLTGIVKEVISDDKNVKEKMKDLMKEIQRDNIRFMLSGITWVLTSAISAAIGAIVMAFVKSGIK